MDRRTQPRLLPVWIGILLASWPFNIVLGKIALRFFPPIALASFRLLVAAVIMPLIFVVARRNSDSSPTSFTLRDIKTLSWLALTGVILNQGCFIIGLNHTSAAHSALILATGPITIFLLAWLREIESATWRKVAGLTFAFCGVSMLATEHGFQPRSPNLLGDIITLCGSVGFALYTISARSWVIRYDAVLVNTLLYSLSAIVVGPIALYEAVTMSQARQWNSVPWSGWLAFVYVTISGSVVAFLIYTWALQYLAPSRAGALTYVHPIMSSSLAVLMLGEPITIGLIMGGLLILAGLYLTQSGQLISHHGQQRGYVAKP
jgi:drug/metabolite transporter (DMT)-like permease